MNKREWIVFATIVLSLILSLTSLIVRETLFNGSFIPALIFLGILVIAVLFWIGPLFRSIFSRQDVLVDRATSGKTKEEILKHYNRYIWISIINSILLALALFFWHKYYLDSFGWKFYFREGIVLIVYNLFNYNYLKKVKAKLN